MPDLMEAFCQPENNQGASGMKFGMTSLALLAVMASAPAYAQNPFMDRAKEAAARRAENEAVRQAENPQAANQTAAAKPPEAAAAPAEAAPAAPAAPAEPAAPATPAQPAQ
jgi:2-oxoglutarate dehydrogenase E2 component (dihydrolipoamide succinyltransferase)